jgi:hypothetical protein
MLHEMHDLVRLLEKMPLKLEASNSSSIDISK